MLQFGKREPEASSGRRRRPPNFLSRRSERQLLYLLGLFLLVLILIQQARQPKNWTWLWSLQNAASRRAAATDEKIDTRVREPLPKSEPSSPRGLVILPGEREGVSPTVKARPTVPPAGLRPAARLSNEPPLIAEGEREGVSPTVKARPTVPPAGLRPAARLSNEPPLIAEGEREGVSPTVKARPTVPPAGLRPAARLSTAPPLIAEGEREGVSPTVKARPTVPPAGLRPAARLSNEPPLIAEGEREGVSPTVKARPAVPPAGLRPAARLSNEPPLIAEGEREGVSPTVKARPTVPPAGLRPAARLSTAPPPTAADAWSQLLPNLDGDDRQRFFRLLKAVRDGRPATDEDRAAWPGVLAQLETGWAQHLQRLRQDTEADDARWTEDERQLRRTATDGLQQEWAQRWQLALQTLAAPSPPSPEVRQSLDELQRTLDTVFLKAVRDNTVFTDSEKDAWFRLFEKLQQADPGRLAQASRGEVAFAQLYREPEAYRGQLVTVRGTVRLGYYRQAPRNLYGIDGYYLFWLRPVGSTNPIVVYSLEVPQGFPDVRTLEAQGRKPELFEDVEFTGYFFKRWAYRAEDGTRLAPLILAKCPRWEPALGGTGREPGGLPSLPVLALGVLAALLFAVVFVVIVYRSGRRTGAAAAHAAATDPELEKRLAELAQK